MPSMINNNVEIMSTDIEKTQETQLKDLRVVKLIGQSKVSVFLARSKSTKQEFALKVFPYYKNSIHPDYLTESSFISLEHPNIIKMISCSNKQKITTRPGHSNFVSLVLMELATHGDFFELLLTQQTLLTVKMARTYFHQLIKAIEYMHSQGVAHRDLKLENLLVSEDYQLKVADFDTACSTDKLGFPLNSNYGTFCYRAPEVINKNCIDFAAADVYSCGILLFLFKAGGALPHCEDKHFKDTDLLDLLNNDKKGFWEKHCELQNRKADFFDDDFKELFEGMTDCDANKRFNMENIKASKWYQGSVYSNEQLASIIKAKA